MGFSHSFVCPVNCIVLGREFRVSENLMGLSERAP